MADNTGPKVDKPAEHFKRPKDVSKDDKLSEQEKKSALDTWEQDARQLLTASNEGMPGPEEGVKRNDTPRLDEVVKAKEKMGETPNSKPSH
jgi:hypothetical protein